MEVSCLKNLNRSTPGIQKCSTFRRRGNVPTVLLKAPSTCTDTFSLPPIGEVVLLRSRGILLPGSCLIALENTHAHRRSTTAGCMPKTNERTNDGTTRLSVRTYLPYVITCCRASNSRSGTGPVSSPQSSNKVSAVPIIKPLEYLPS